MVDENLVNPGGGVVEQRKTSSASSSSSSLSASAEPVVGAPNEKPATSVEPLKSDEVRALDVDPRMPAYTGCDDSPPSLWGVFPVRNEKLAALTRTVSLLSILCGTLLFVSSLLQFCIGSWLWGMVLLIIAVLLPISGFLGARGARQQLLMCFAGCNCVLVIFILITMIFFIMSVISLSTTGGISGCKDRSYFVVDGNVYECDTVIRVTVAQIILMFLEALFYTICFSLAFKLAKQHAIAPQISTPGVQMDTYNHTYPQQFATPTNPGGTIYGQRVEGPIAPAPPIPAHVV